MAEYYDNGGRLTTYDYVPDPEDYENGKMVNYEQLKKINYDSEDSTETEDDEYEYLLKKEIYYKNIFSKPLKKIKIAISSSDRDVSVFPNVENCTILFNGTNNINEFNNVVGFNILSVSIPVSYYNINTDNKAKITGAAVSSASNGYYTTSDLTGITDINSYDEKTGKLTFGTETKTSGITTLDKSIAKVLGLGLHSGNTYYTSGSPSDNTIMTDVRATAHLDIEIINIPSIVCISSNYSKNIVTRIPVSKSFGEIIEYKAETTQLSSNHFFPIKLTQLEIKILDEFGINVGMNGIDYSLVCEITILGDLPEDL